MDNSNETTQVIFISGNLDLTEKKFIQYYLPLISELAKDENVYFNISDEEGCAEMTQILLNKLVKDKSKVNIFCTGETPNCYISEDFICFNDFKTVEQRNAAMTISSNIDLHVILPGKGRSLVESNLCRRNSPEYNFTKFYTNLNTFWRIFITGEINNLKIKENA